MTTGRRRFARIRFSPLEVGIAVLGIVTVGAFTFVGQTTENSLLQARTATKASQTIHIDLALSHLWLEEYVSGDTAVDVVADVEKPLRQAIDICLALRKGGPHVFGYFPRPEVDRRKQVDRLCDALAGLSQATDERIGSDMPLGPSRDLDYDARFNRTLVLSKQNLIVSEAAIARLVDRNDNLRLILVVAIFFLFAAALGLVRRYVAKMHDRQAELAEAYSKVESALEQGHRFEKLRNDMVANVSHELRTPLVPIMGWSQYLSRRPETDPSQVQEYASIIHKGAQRLSVLIEDFLTVATRRADDAHLSRVSVQAIVRAVADEVRQRGGRPNVSVAKDAETVVTDRRKLIACLGYLADNAVKFGPSGGAVDIEVKRSPEGRTTISVIDDGPGVPDSLNDGLGLFVQGDGGTTRVHGGTGVGLFLASAIARDLGGYLDVSNVPGRGACFSIVLPDMAHAR